MTVSASTEPLFEPLSPRFLDDPYPTYRRLRQEDPVHWHEQLGSWVLSRHDDCLRVIQDSDRFAADYRRVGLSVPPPAISVQTLDPPEQLTVRRLMVDAFRAQDLRTLTEDLRIWMQRWLGRRSDGEVIEFVADVAIPVASRAVAILVGGDLSQRDDFQEASRAVVRSMIAGAVPELERPGIEARALLSEMIHDVYRRQPSRGILGFLRRNAAEQLTHADLLVNSLRAVLLAGLNSGQRFLATALHSLLRTPGGLDAFRAVPSAGRQTALSELVRFDSPFQAQERAATSEVSLRGKRIARGDRVVVLFGAAHRDPERFADPDRLVLARHPNPHFGFGRGAHSCLGATLAFAEANVVLAEFVSRYPASCLAAEPVHEPNPTLRGLVDLPVRLRS